MAIRFILAPISSWSTDTTGFAQGELAFVFHGSPYSAFSLFNPPLASFLQAPFFFLLLLVVPAQNLVTFVPSLLPASAALGPGFISPWVPSPSALIALKIPLILGDVVTTLLLVLLLRRAGRPELATWAGAAYFLNPLVIFVSSVHAEPDGLAAGLVLLFVAGLVFRSPFVSGMALSLAFFAKAYPVILVPIALGFWLAAGSPRPHRPFARFRPLGQFALGAVVPVLFLGPYNQFFRSAFQRMTPVSNFGGVSLLVLYNSGSPPLWGFRAGWNGLVSGGSFLLLLEGAAALAVVLGAFWATRTGRRVRLGDGSAVGVRPIATATLVTVSGLLLAYPAPQPENLLAVVPLVALALPLISRRWASRLVYWTVSLSGFSLYLVFGTPFQGFTPLLVLLGPQAIASASQVMISYGSGAFLMRPSYYWFVPGLVGGVALVAAWALCLRALIPREVGTAVRSFIDRRSN